MGPSLCFVDETKNCEQLGMNCLLVYLCDHIEPRFAFFLRKDSNFKIDLVPEDSLSLGTKAVTLLNH